MEKLKLKDVRKDLPFQTHHVNLFWNVYSIIKDNRTIDFDVFLPSKGINLQRPFCWTLEQNQQLILSVIKKLYIPKLAVLVNQSCDDINYETRLSRYQYQIIDGKQRLNALLSFMRGEFPIDVNGNLYYFADLDEDTQWAIKGYSPACEVAYFSEHEPIPDEDKILWFKQINFSGTPQDKAHLDTLNK